MKNAIYMFGCSCGSKGRGASTVQRKIGATIYNTKRDSNRLKEQIAYLYQAGIDINGYPSIVVEQGGQRISLLNEWK